MKLINILLIIACLAFSSVVSMPDIPLDHPFYRDLPLFLQKTVRLSFDPSAKPYSIPKALILLKITASDSLSPHQVLARQYLCEFEPESCSGRPADKPIFRFSFASDSGDCISFYPVLKITTAIQDSHFNVRGYQLFRNDTTPGLIETDSMGPNHEFSGYVHTGAVITGSIGKASLYFKGGLDTRYTSREAWVKTNNPHRGYMLTNILEKEDVPGHLIGWDSFISYISLPLSFMDLKVGRDAVSWGYSDDRNLLFSGQAAPFFHLRADKSVGPVHFQFVMGRITAEDYLQKRYVYAKRITWQVKPWATLGFSDMAISINRELEPLYFLPMVPYFFAEHFVGDLDNRLMSVDAHLRAGGLFSFYTEFMLDDMRDFATIFNDSDNSNKWGITSGLVLDKSPWPRALSSATLEFSQIEPWVYTTSQRDNLDSLGTRLYNYPVHFGSLLGSPLGANSRNISLKLLSRPHTDWRFGLRAQNIWKGSGPGSSLSDVNMVYVPGGWVRRWVTKRGIRMQNWVTDRFVLSADAGCRLRTWNETSVTLNYVHEQLTLPGSYFQAQVNSVFNF